jgi:magnesium-transporting ATPase (P-type)
MGTTVDTQNVVNRGHDPNRRSGATPLQRRLNEVGEVLALAALAIVGVVFAWDCYVEKISRSCSLPP